MNYGILGTGKVGLTISNRLAELGHTVVIGTREPSQLGDRLRPRHAAVNPGTFADAAAAGQVIFNATNGAGSLAALKLAGASNLDGKVLVDISNPLDFSKGMPPALFVMNTDSLGEQIQRAFPNARVVKALNMVTAAIMIDPRRVASGDHDTFICGNDAGAKEVVMAILREFGWLHITDLGDITSARGMEMYLPIWLKLWSVLGTGMFNVKIVR